MIDLCDDLPVVTVADEGKHVHELHCAELCVNRHDGGRGGLRAYFSIVFEFWLYALATHFHSPSILSRSRTALRDAAREFRSGLDDRVVVCDVRSHFISLSLFAALLRHVLAERRGLYYNIFHKHKNALFCIILTKRKPMSAK